MKRETTLIEIELLMWFPIYGLLGWIAAFSYLYLARSSGLNDFRRAYCSFMEIGV